MHFLKSKILWHICKYTTLILTLYFLGLEIIGVAGALVGGFLMFCVIALYKNRRTNRYKVNNGKTLKRFCPQKRQDRSRLRENKINISESTDPEEIDIRDIDVPKLRRTFSLQERRGILREGNIIISDSTDSEEPDIKDSLIRRRTFSL